MSAFITKSSAKVLNRATLTRRPVDKLKHDEAHFDELTDREFVDGGPVLYAAHIDDQPGIGKVVRDPAMIRSSFMRGLGTSRGGDLDQ